MKRKLGIYWGYIDSPRTRACTLSVSSRSGDLRNWLVKVYPSPTETEPEEDPCREMPVLWRAYMKFHINSLGDGKP